MALWQPLYQPKTRRSVPVLIGLALWLAGCAHPTSIADAYNATPRNAADAYASLGHQYLLRGTFDLAEARLLHAIHLNPELPAAHHDLAIVYTALGRFDDADREYRVALNLTPTDPTALYNYATLLYNRGHYPEAATQLQILITANPQADNRAQAYEALGLIAVKNKDLTQAEIDFKQALNMTPTLSRSWLALATLYLDTKRVDLARDSFQHYQSITHDTPEGLWFGIRIARARGDDTLVADYSQRLRIKFPDSDQARQLYAERHHPSSIP